MFFNKYIINCTVKCIEKNIIYNEDKNGKTTHTAEYLFIFVEPENTKILYAYDNNASLYDINTTYKAKFNKKDGTFKIIKKR